MSDSPQERAFNKAWIKRLIPARWLAVILGAPRLRRLRNRLQGRVFACTALQGESNYDICVNSDMTVSCHCRDYDGSGHIGDLATQSLQEIFDDETAQRLRQTLAKNQFPLAACPDCSELKSIPRRDIQRYLTEYHVPQRGIMVENTVQCNLRCRSCQRETVMRSRRKTALSLQNVEKVAATIRQYGIAEITYHNLGEPFLSKTIYAELRILRDRNPDLRIVVSTNGVFVDTPDKQDAALLTDQIFFSIDGPSQDILARYQVGGDFERAYGNLKTLVALRNERGADRPIIEWKYVVFAWNDLPEHIEQAVALARASGVDLISFWLGGGLSSHVSRRFPIAPHFRNLGRASWKGREVSFR
ncbi:MAG: radical SAM protein [Nitrospiraceae bacterium]|nr:radical SAM protein [Nitrospiraceae bacterium]